MSLCFAQARVNPDTESMAVFSCVESRRGTECLSSTQRAVLNRDEKHYYELFLKRFFENPIAPSACRS